MNARPSITGGRAFQLAKRCYGHDAVLTAIKARRAERSITGRPWGLREGVADLAHEARRVLRAARRAGHTVKEKPWQ